VPIELSMVWIVVFNVFGWLFIQLGLAWAFTNMPSTWFMPGKTRKWEQEGRFYERMFNIKRWKGRLPDAAGWFSGGFAKRTLTRSDPNHLRRFICETWRGELCHWAAMGCVPLFFLWNPWWGDLVIIFYAAVANLPCILAQRYNRARFQRCIGRESL